MLDATRETAETEVNPVQEAINKRYLTDSDIASLLGKTEDEIRKLSLLDKLNVLLEHQSVYWSEYENGNQNYQKTVEVFGEGQPVRVGGCELKVMYRPFRNNRPTDTQTKEGSGTDPESVNLCALDALCQQPNQKGLRFGLNESIQGLNVTQEYTKTFLQSYTGTEDASNLDTTILVNPYIIFENQITAPTNLHQPQKSINIMFHLLNMSRQLEMNGIFNPKDFNASMKNHAHGQLMPEKLPIFEGLERIRAGSETAYETIRHSHMRDNVLVFVPNEGELYVSPVVISGANIFQVLEAYAEIQKRLYADGIEKASVVYEYNKTTGEYTIAMIPRKKPRSDNFEVTIEFEEDGKIVTENHVVMCSFASAEEGGGIVANRRKDLEDQEHDLKLLLDPLRGPKIIEAIYKAVNEERASFMQRLKNTS